MPEDEEKDDPIKTEEPTEPTEPEESKPNTMFDDIKIMCNIPKTNSDFDTQIQIAANSVLSTLRQIGTFTGNLYFITSESVWEDLETDQEIQAVVKEYVCLRTRLTFDPPQSSSLETALTGRIDELEFRINVLTDTREIKEGSNE